jgi:hypothetical protein
MPLQQSCFSDSGFFWGRPQQHARYPLRVLFQFVFSVVAFVIETLFLFLVCSFIYLKPVDLPWLGLNKTLKTLTPFNSPGTWTVELLGRGYGHRDLLRYRQRRRLSWF